MSYSKEEQEADFNWWYATLGSSAFTHDRDYPPCDLWRLRVVEVAAGALHWAGVGGHRVAIVGKCLYKRGGNKYRGGINGGWYLASIRVPPDGDVEGAKLELLRLATPKIEQLKVEWGQTEKPNVKGNDHE